MRGGTDEVDKVRGDAVVDVDAPTADVYHLQSTWRREGETRGPQVPFSILMLSA
jgi:hypothetical protein